MKKIFTLIFSSILITNFSLANSSCLTCDDPGIVNISRLAQDWDSARVTVYGANTNDVIEIEYGPSGFNIGTGISLSKTYTSSDDRKFYIYAPAIMYVDNDYDIYTRFICVNGDTSNWVLDQYTAPVYINNYLSQLNVNNITANFYPNGLLFNDPGSSSSGLSINGIGPTIYSSRMWFGGLDNNSNPRVVASRYQYDNNGLGYTTDSVMYGIFTPGPIGNCDAISRINYNKLWKVTQAEIDSFIDWYQCSITPACTPDPNYTIPNDILTWPGNGHTPCGHNEFIAPFNDEDLDGIYEPLDGETPCIKGDMALFNVYNDLGGYSGSDNKHMGIEVRVLHYAFSSNNDDALNNTIFSDYAVINNSQNTYTDFYVSNWADMDILSYLDDYVGSDPSRGLFYTYNGANNDLAQGICVLNGLKKDTDGQDNPLSNDVNIAIAQGGIPYDGLGCGYGDGIVDNERVGLANMMYFDYSSPNVAISDPQITSEYYYFMQNKWRDGSNLVYGGSGHQNNAPTPLQNTSFSFPGNNDPLNWGTASQGSGNTVAYGNWSEEFPNGPSSSSNPPGDRRLVGSIGPTTLYPFNGNIDNIQEFSLAYISATNDSVSNTNSVNMLKQYTDQIRSTFACDQNGMYGNCSSLIASNNDEATTIANVNEIRIYPNPANQSIFLSSNVNIKEVTVLDLTGKIVLNKVANSNLEQLDVSSFKNGLYLLKISDENQRFYVEQFIKN